MASKKRTTRKKASPSSPEARDIVFVAKSDGSSCVLTLDRLKPLPDDDLPRRVVLYPSSSGDWKSQPIPLLRGIQYTFIWRMAGQTGNSFNVTAQNTSLPKNPPDDGPVGGRVPPGGTHTGGYADFEVL